MPRPQNRHHACSMTQARLVVLMLFAFFAPALAQAATCECKDVKDMIYRIKEANALIAEYKNQIKGMEAKEARTGKPLMYTDSLYRDTMQPRLRTVVDQLRNAEPGEQANTMNGETNGSACSSEITGGTACLREAVTRHESHHSNMCHLKKGNVFIDLLTDFDYRKDMRLAEVAQEEIVGYNLEINYLTVKLEALRKHCKGYRPTKLGAIALSGVICSLEKPFSLNGTFGSHNIVLKASYKFVPSSETAGTWSVSLGRANASGYEATLTPGVGGSYTIVGADTDKPRIVTVGQGQGTVNASTPIGPVTTTSSVSGLTGQFDLVPLETDECNEP